MIAAMDPDNISLLMLKNLGPNGIQYLNLTIKLLISSAQIPRILKMGMIISIYGYKPHPTWTQHEKAKSSECPGNPGPYERILHLYSQFHDQPSLRLVTPHHYHLLCIKLPSWPSRICVQKISAHG